MIQIAILVSGLLLLIMAVALFLAALKIRNLSRENRRLQHSLARAGKMIASLEGRRKLSDQSRNKRLRSYLRLMDTLVNTIPNPIYYKDADGVFQGCNRAFASDLLGLKRDRIIGRRAQQLGGVIPPAAAALWRKHELKMMEMEARHQFEMELACADGGCREFLVTMAPVKDSRGQVLGSVGVMLDLTEKNRAARERIQKEKLQGVLETAGAVCHELNQPLQALSGYAELAQSGISASDDYTTLVEKIRDQVERMARITRKLHNITRYAAKDYVGDLRIIDIDKASG